MSVFAHPCNKPGCGALTRSRFCAKHAPLDVRTRAPDHRESASKRGYDSRWRRYRLDFLRRNPLCRECERKGRIIPAQHVDHIRPISQGGSFWNETNHQPLCAPCHTSKTIRERHQ